MCRLCFLDDEKHKNQASESSGLTGKQLCAYESYKGHITRTIVKLEARKYNGVESLSMKVKMQKDVYLGGRIVICDELRIACSTHLSSMRSSQNMLEHF